MEDGQKQCCWGVGPGDAPAAATRSANKNIYRFPVQRLPDKVQEVLHIPELAEQEQPRLLQLAEPGLLELHDVLSEDSGAYPAQKRNDFD